MNFKSKRNIINKISIAIIIIFACSLMDYSLIKANADVGNKPSFEVQINDAKPNPALVGEDITISGKIIPKPFEMKKEYQKKEIVLVLDTSGSMNDRANHKSKIEELKKAANNFIDKLIVIPNTKIGIVSYSGNANIESDKNGTYFSDDTQALHYRVNNLRADGGTNTGEGLRKAQYVLENGDKDAKKSIVFMSDGLPTFYSIERINNKGYEDYKFEKIGWNWYKNDRSYYDVYYNRDDREFYNQYYSRDYYWTGWQWNWGEYYKNSKLYYKYYTRIDNENPERGGTGYSDTTEQCKNYAKEIGEIIKNNKANIFSIGYGLGDDYSEGNRTMREIHDSMGGVTEDFFATDTGAIDEIFNQIGNKIIDSYTIDNLEMDMNFKSEDGFNLKLGDNTIKMSNIVYKKVSESARKTVYEAPEIPFKFVITGKKAGEYKNVFEKSEVKFLWNDNKVNIPVTTNKDLIITIKENELPQIKATLISEKNLTLKNSAQEIEVKYKIDTQPFEYNTDGTLKLQDGELNFDLGNNFELLESKDLVKIQGEGNRYKVSLPQIQYTLENEDENNKKWVQKEPIEIGFKIKKNPNSTSSNLEFGQGENNNISYTTFRNEKRCNKIDTPIVNFETINIKHGIYNGIINGSLHIDERLNTYAKQANVTFGASFNLYNDKTCYLNIEEGKIKGEIKVYKFANNKLQQIGIMTNENQNSYSFSFSNISNMGDVILIIYNETLPNESGDYSNNITFKDNTESKNVKIKVGHEELPELF